MYSPFRYVRWLIYKFTINIFKYFYVKETK